MNLYIGENITRLERKEKCREVLRHYCEWRKTSFCPDKTGQNQIGFAIGAHGKPYLEGKAADGLPIHFSISHSGRFWVCGVDDSPLGIDIEDMAIRRDGTDRLFKIAARFFAPQEVVFANTPEKFYQVWTRKEAYIKYKGTGISEGLSSFSTIDDKNQLIDKIGEAYLGEIDSSDGRIFSCGQFVYAWCSAKLQAPKSEHIFQLKGLS